MDLLSVDISRSAFINLYRDVSNGGFGERSADAEENRRERKREGERFFYKLFASIVCTDRYQSSRENPIRSKSELEKLSDRHDVLFHRSYHVADRTAESWFYLPVLPRGSASLASGRSRRKGEKRVVAKRSVLEQVYETFISARLAIHQAYQGGSGSFLVRVLVNLSVNERHRGGHISRLSYWGRGASWKLSSRQIGRIRIRALAHGFYNVSARLCDCASAVRSEDRHIPMVNQLWSLLFRARDARFGRAIRGKRAFRISVIANTMLL